MENSRKELEAAHEELTTLRKDVNKLRGQVFHQNNRIFFSFFVEKEVRERDSAEIHIYLK